MGVYKMRLMVESYVNNALQHAANRAEKNRMAKLKKQERVNKKTAEKESDYRHMVCRECGSNVGG